MELILLEQVAQLGEPGDLVNALLSAEADRKEAALKLATQLEEIQIKLAVAVSEEGTLYGSIGTREISEAIIEQGVNIEKSSVRLSEGALKEVGDYQVDIELHPEVVQSVSVIIEAITEE